MKGLPSIAFDQCLQQPELGKAKAGDLELHLCLLLLPTGDPTRLSFLLVSQVQFQTAELEMGLSGLSLEYCQIHIMCQFNMVNQIPNDKYIILYLWQLILLESTRKFRRDVFALGLKCHLRGFCHIMEYLGLIYDSRSYCKPVANINLGSSR